MASAAARPATLGGLPTKDVDVPICGVLLGCYIALAGTHMTIYRRNVKRNRRFRHSLGMYGFCMARIATWSVRIAWACIPTSTTLAIVANVLVAAGVILLWIINRIFATRLLAEYHPRLYNQQPYSFFLTRLPYVLVMCCLPMLITAVVQEFSNPSAHTLYIDSIILKVALAVFVAFAFSPFLILLLTYLAPYGRGKEEVMELQQRLGTGRTTTKVTVIAVATALLVWELGIRVATILQTFSMANAPWYYSKASFYVFIPGFELIVLTMYAVMRVDRLFYVYGPSEQPPDAEELRMV